MSRPQDAIVKLSRGESVEVARSDGESASGEALPEGWASIRFDELYEYAQNGCGTRRSTDGTPTVVLRLADISTDGTIATAALREIQLNDTNREKYALEPDNLLAFRVNGSADIAGQVVRYTGPSGYTFCDHFIRFRLDTVAIDPKFAALAFRSHGVRREVEQRMVSSAGQNTVSQGSFAEIELPVAPKAEQSRIVSAIESLQERSSRARVLLSEVGPLIGQLRQSVLRGAFSGRLTADWRASHPVDEPASELLLRIRTERRERWEAEQLAK